MCGGFVGDLVGAGNPMKVLKNPLSAAKSIYKLSEKTSVGAQVMNATGTNYVGKAIYGKDDAQAAAEKAARDAANADAQAAADARAQAANAYNADAIASKRRRRAGSVLSRSGAGITSTVDSVLAAAATYGKQTLGA